MRSDRSPTPVLPIPRSDDSASRREPAAEGPPRRLPLGSRRSAHLSVVIAALLFLRVRGSCAQEFRIDEWRAYALVGSPGLQSGSQYVLFSGDQGFNGWLPERRDLVTYVERDASLFARFQLRIVNLEGPLPGLSGRAIDKMTDEPLLYSLKAAGYDVVARANNHGLDLGRRGVTYTDEKLAAAGLQSLGGRRSPVFHWRAGDARIDICALADVMDLPDPDRLFLMIDDEDLALVRREVAGADFRIAFAHLGSVSRFVSPHERAQANRLLSAGFDLVVCTGSHFIKGFVTEGGRPVAYGLGDHLTSLVYGRSDTEPLGMHLVAGFEGGRLTQVFVVPFHNDARRGRVGPLDEAAFGRFVGTLRERSVSNSAKYYSDRGALKAMLQSVKSLTPSGLARLKPRHIAYAFRIVVEQRPEWLVFGVVIAVAAAVIVLRRRSSRLRKRKEASTT